MLVPFDLSAEPNDIYFITNSIINYIDLFTCNEYSEIIIDSLNHCSREKGLNVHAWCLMPGYLELIASAQQEQTFADIMRDFKKFTSKKITKTIQLIDENRKDWLLDKFEFAGRYNTKIKDYKVWQDGYNPVRCFSPDFLRQKIDKVHHCPVKEGFVWEPQHYALSSAVDYYEQRKGKVDVVLLKIN